MLNASVAYKVAFALILWRAWLSIFIRTSFDPDEYWQGPEVAHRLVFGYGHLTWEWAAGLRSYAHPLLFTPGLLLLRLLRLDSPTAVQLAPRATQAVLSLVHDAVLMAFVHSHLPTHLHLPTMLISCLSWFNCFTHSRPFSNSVESTLHLAVLAAWPRINRPATSTSALTAHPKTRRAWRAVAITLAGLCCIVRPPAAVLFLPVAALEILHAPSPTSTPAPTLSTRLLHAATYICDCVVLAALIVVSNGLMDRHFYGQWVFPAWVNLEFNVLQNSSADYGTHPPHWYFSQGIPAMLGSLLPLVVWGVWTSARHRRDDSCSSRHMPLWPFFLAVWGVAIHSVLPHKEFRYILPSFELILLYAAVPLLRPGAEESQAGPPQAGSTHPRAEPVDAHASAAQPAAHATGLRQRVAAQAVADVQPSEEHAGRAGPRAAADTPWRKAIWAAAVSLQLPMLAYFGLVHQRGTIAVLEHLSRASILPGSGILFLTNCHATPWQAHMHREDLSMTFLDCSPPEWFEATRAQNAPGSIGTMMVTDSRFRDEQRAFEADPLHALCKVYGCMGKREHSIDDGASDTTCSLDSNNCELDSNEQAGHYRALPVYMVMFEDMARDVSAFLTEHGYFVEQTFVQNPFEGKYVVLYKL